MGDVMETDWPNAIPGEGDSYGRLCTNHQARYLIYVIFLCVLF